MRAAEHNHGGREGTNTVEHLVEHLAEFVTPSTVIVCIGNELSGDDAAGVLVARELADKVPWCVFEAQTVPESFLMKIVERKPDCVLLIDALDFGGRPGAIELVSAEKIGAQGPSTHGPAPLAFLELLEMMHPCRRMVLGIQPKTGGFGEPVTPAVQKGVDLVVQAFRRLAER